LKTFVAFLAVALAPAVFAQDWQAVTGEDELRALFSDTVMTASLKEGVTAEATYNADGTGELQAWGDTFPRSWQIKSQDRICIGIDEQLQCFNIEKDADSGRYRARNVASGESIDFDVTGHEIAVDDIPETSSGSASQPSAEEVAAALANPNAPMASLTFRLQHRTFDGDVPDASNQSGSTLAFQPSFPFTQSNGDVIFFRPNIPIQLTFARPGDGRFQE
jgi:hypothetical protein